MSTCNTSRPGITAPTRSVGKARRIHAGLPAGVLGPVAKRAAIQSSASASCEPWQDTASIFWSMVELTSTQTFGFKDPDR